jgi:hypothetical protein
MAAVGDRLFVWIDRKLVFTATDSTLKEGMVGLSVNSATAAFKDVEVLERKEAPSPVQPSQVDGAKKQ